MNIYICATNRNASQAVIAENVRNQYVANDQSTLNGGEEWA